jgi:hypothetical protein
VRARAALRILSSLVRIRARWRKVSRSGEEHQAGARGRGVAEAGDQSFWFVVCLHNGHSKLSVDVASSEPNYKISDIHFSAAPYFACFVPSREPPRQKVSRSAKIAKQRAAD